jgi:hypothetical protein
MQHVVPVRPQSRYPRAPREPGSTLSQPQLHPSIGHCTFAYIRKLADESDAMKTMDVSLFLLILCSVLSCGQKF